MSPASRRELVRVVIKYNDGLSVAMRLASSGTEVGEFVFTLVVARRLWE